MNAPQKLELKSAGQSAMLHVVSAKMATVGRFPEVEFVGTDENNRLVLVAVNEKSATKQLQRSNLTLQSAAGKVLRFGRSANAQDASKPYWDIELVGNGDTPIGRSGTKDTPDFDDDPHAHVPHPAERVNISTAPVADELKMTPKDIYLAITKDTLANIVPLYVAANIPVEMTAVAAIVATRFITARQQNGH